MSEVYERILDQLDNTPQEELLSELERARNNQREIKDRIRAENVLLDRWKAEENALEALIALRRAREGQ